MCVESDRAHTAFARHLNVQFPLVSDFNRQVVKQFGIDYAEDEPFSGWWGMSRHSVFVLDRNGVVRYAWITDDPLVAPDVGEAIKRWSHLRGLSPIGDVPGEVVEWSRFGPLRRFDLGVRVIAVDQRNRDVCIDNEVVHLHPQLRRLLDVSLAFDIIEWADPERIGALSISAGSTAVRRCAIDTHKLAFAISVATFIGHYLIPDGQAKELVEHLDTLLAGHDRGWG